jgi:phage-related protein
VAFTDEQKAQIKTMQEAGDMAGAQGIILAELNKEFGGSAQAAAAATGGWSEFSGRLGEAKETLGAAFLPLLATLGTFLLDNVVPAVEALATAFAAWLADPAVQAGLAQLADALTNGIGVAFTFLTETAIPALVAAWALIQPAIQLVISAFASGGEGASGLGGVINDLAVIWTQLQPVIENVVNAISAVVLAVFGVVQTFIAKHGDEISAFMTDAWNQIMDIITLGIELYNAIVPPILTAIAGFIAAHGTEIQTILGAVWTAISALITAALAIIKGVITVALDLIKGDWGGAWEAMKTMLSTVWDSIKSILSASWDTIKALFGGFASQAADFGANIIQGIVDGVRSGVGALTDAVSGAAQDALDAAKDALGISSPSKVFADQVGANISAGIAMGISSGAAQIAGAMGDVTLDNGSMGASSASASTGTVAPAPGTTVRIVFDAGALQKLITATVEQALSDSGGRALSRIRQGG